MRVLVGCEFSGIVRDAFLARGHDAWSCDLLPTESLGPHLQADIFTVLDADWDLLVAFPPCTHLAYSGARWFPTKLPEQEAALAFVQRLLDASVPRIAIENPCGVIQQRIRQPNQIIQPWQFGHGETKQTCLWLKALPPLLYSDCVTGRRQRILAEPPGPDRWMRRSRTYPGIAAAMAEQWGDLPALGRTSSTEFTLPEPGGIQE